MRKGEAGELTTTTPRGFKVKDHVEYANATDGAYTNGKLLF